MSGCDRRPGCVRPCPARAAPVPRPCPGRTRPARGRARSVFCAQRRDRAGTGPDSQPLGARPDPVRPGRIGFGPVRPDPVRVRPLLSCARRTVRCAGGQGRTESSGGEGRRKGNVPVSGPSPPRESGRPRFSSAGGPLFVRGLPRLSLMRGPLSPFRGRFLPHSGLLPPGRGGRGEEGAFPPARERFARRVPGRLPAGFISHFSGIRIWTLQVN